MSTGNRFYMVVSDEADGEWLAGPFRDADEALGEGRVVRDVTDEVHRVCREEIKSLEARTGTEDEVTIGHRLAEILSVQVLEG